VSAGSFNRATRPGFETLLAALSRLRLDWHLTLVGAGPELGALQERAQQLVLGDRLQLLPPMAHEKLMEYFRSAKAFIEPSGLDGFPTLALHAMSEGCPVIAARAGAVTELIIDQQNGLLFNPGDAQGLSEVVTTLASVRGLSLSLIADGIKTVEKRTWDSTVDATFAALEKLKP
jgi:glycosyltransferase involved in cell wall biosynthesis